MIVATAGHIDHGKTSLVKALTGVDADRLPEEKARGITLDLGFAYRGALGFVDVPGHEKLVRTMVAGATGVDCALLVIAADDGPMPQTREHLAILDLLGIARGLIAITKSDRVEAGRLAALDAEIRELLSGTCLADAPILPCSSQTGAGIAELSALLSDAAVAAPAVDAPDQGFRLAIDRCFTLTGTGLVVTGAVHAGTVRVGDRLLLSPGDREVRVRGLRTQNAEAETGTAGQRCALNLTGARLSRDDIHRGDWILAPDLHAPTTRLDVRLRLLPGEAKPLKHRSAVQVHLGATTVAGRVLLPDGPLDPGDHSIAQLSLDAPIGALARDRFVLRDASAQRTLGGGRVIDPFGPRRGHRSPERLARVAALEASDDADALARLLTLDENGVDLDAFRLARNIGPNAEAALHARLGLVAFAGPTGRLGLDPERFAVLGDNLLIALDSVHAAEPDNPGLSADELGKLYAPARRPAVRAALDRLLAEGRIARAAGALLHRPGHVVRLSPADTELWEQIRTILAAAGLDQPRLALMAEQLRLEPDVCRVFLDKLGRIGWLRRISKSYYMLPEIVAELASHAEAVAAEHPEGLLTVGRYREATGIGRNMTMPLLEHFDAAGVTTRINEGRRIRAGWREVFAGTQEGSDAPIHPTETLETLPLSRTPGAQRKAIRDPV